MRYRPHEFADIAGVTVKTLHRWDESGKLSAERTVGGHRYYTEKHVYKLKGIVNFKPKVVIYTRVSSPSQKPELANQTTAMQNFCTANGVVVDEVIEEIGGGLNFKRKKFLALLSDIVSGRVKSVYIAHKDRLCRFAFDLIEYLACLNDCSIVVANNTFLSPQQELVEDMMAIVHCFSCRLYGKRNYKEKFKENLDTNLDIKVKYQQDVQC
ncbi:MAG: IS607 family transposase [Crocosphaera sp.]|jgi:putative resolvase